MSGTTPVLRAAERSRVGVVMPALNEADALPAALEDRPADLPVLVVDNGSTDGTGAVARDLGADVVTEPQRGFGAACWRGARESDDAEVLVYCDADATFTWPDIERVAAAVVRDRADLALCWRRPDLREPGSLPREVAAANRVLGWLCGRLAGVRLHDLGPLRAIRRETLLGLGVTDRTFGWPLEMVLRAGRRGLRITEVPVRYRVRVGTSKVTGRLWPTLRTTACMLGVLARHAAGR